MAQCTAQVDTTNPDLGQVLMSQQSVYLGQIGTQLKNVV